MEALTERELRRAMARAGIESLPLDPEGRACHRPPARRRIDLFEDVRRHEWRTGRGPAEVFGADLTLLQRQVLHWLGMPRAFGG